MFFGSSLSGRLAELAGHSRRTRRCLRKLRNVYSLIFRAPGVAGSLGNNYGEMRYAVNGARARRMDTLTGERANDRFSLG